MRDVQIPSIVFVGCIGPVFLCLLAVVLIYVALQLPMWVHGPELQSALNHYEQIRAAVFRSEMPLSALESVATDPYLQELLVESAKTRANNTSMRNAELITIARIREYIDSCSIITVDKYHHFSDVAFVLKKIQGIWKVQRIVPSHNAGVFGALNLRTC